MSRRTRAAIIAVCILIALLFTWLDRALYQRRLDSQDLSVSQKQSADIEKYHGKTFDVANIVDGDTIDISVPDGNYDNTRIRMWGIDTPETYGGEMYFAKEAKEFAACLAMGKTVTVHLEQHRSRGKYGRLLAYVQLPDKTILNEQLIEQGFAYADLRFDHSFYHKYKQLQNKAKRNEKGLWQLVTQERLPEWLQQREPELIKEK
jgi:micrococcal nuclease